MKSSLAVGVLIIAFSLNSYSQQTDSSSIAPVNRETQHLYKIKPWIDVPATLVFGAAAVYGMSVIYGRKEIPADVVMALDKNTINKLDRPIAENYSLGAKATSDYFFYGSMPLPLLLLFDKKIRKDGARVGLLYLEALGVTGIFYAGSAMLVNRYRPYTYNPNVPIATRQNGNSRNSFIAGHPALVATSTFFMAKIYSDYHPNMKHKWILFASAGVISAATGYLRIKAGHHFITDVISGLVIGSLVGVLVPHIHKNKKFNSSKLTLVPNFQNGSSGFTAYYKLGK